MLFFYPMWDNESQRIGKQKCTPLGYLFHSIAELLGFFGLLFGFGVAVYLVYEGIARSFKASYLWLFIVPFGLGLIGNGLYQFSWWLAFRKNFKYDYDRREASWDEDGKHIVYKWNPDENIT